MTGLEDRDSRHQYMLELADTSMLGLVDTSKKPEHLAFTMNLLNKYELKRKSQQKI